MNSANFTLYDIKFNVLVLHNTRGGNNSHCVSINLDLGFCLNLSVLRFYEVGLNVAQSLGSNSAFELVDDTKSDIVSFET